MAHKGRALCTELEAWIVERLLGAPAAAETLKPPLEFDLAEYEGVYSNVKSLSTVRVTADVAEGTLTLETAPNRRV